VKPENVEKMIADGDDLLDQIQSILKSKFGDDALAKESLDDFQQEIGALSYAVNNIQATIASLLIQRFVAQGDELEGSVDIIRQMMMADTHESAMEGLRRFQLGLAIATALSKKPTSH
jgi:hypothetical protein